MRAMVKHLFRSGVTYCLVFSTSLFSRLFHTCRCLFHPQEYPFLTYPSYLSLRCLSQTTHSYFQIVWGSATVLFITFKCHISFSSVAPILLFTPYFYILANVWLTIDYHYVSQAFLSPSVIQ